MHACHVIVEAEGIDSKGSKLALAIGDTGCGGTDLVPNSIFASHMQTTTLLPTFNEDWNAKK
jgi:hypothetical protein